MLDVLLLVGQQSAMWSTCLELPKWRPRDQSCKLKPKPWNRHWRTRELRHRPHRPHRPHRHLRHLRRLRRLRRRPRHLQLILTQRAVTDCGQLWGLRRTASSESELQSIPNSISTLNANTLEEADEKKIACTSFSRSTFWRICRLVTCSAQSIAQWMDGIVGAAIGGSVGWV